MPSKTWTTLVPAAKSEMTRNVKVGEVPGRTHPSLTGENIAVSCFNARNARRAAAEHGKTCPNEDCQTHVTLTKPSVRISAIYVAPIFGPQFVERLLSPGEARAMAASLWAGADLAEATS